MHPRMARVRARDFGGGGSFGDPRARNPDGHRGTDFCANTGDTARSVMSGRVSLGSPYGIGSDVPANRRYLTSVLVSSGNYFASHNYVTPLPGIRNGSVVRGGQAIGLTQNLRLAYGATVSNHVDVKIRFNGRYVDPVSLIGIGRPNIVGCYRSVSTVGR